jgi:hypothetical protein
VIAALAASAPLTTPPSVTALTSLTIVTMIGLAFVVDYLSIGPDSWRDRFAFMILLPSIYAGWADSGLHKGLKKLISDTTASGVKATGSTEDPAAMGEAAVKFLVLLVLIYTLGCMAPAKWQQKCGRWAALSFKTKAKARMNIKLWACAIILGVLGSVLGGLSGQVLTTALDLSAHITAGLPAMLVGE